MPDIPEDVRRLADARRTARISHEYEEADRLRAELAAAGWQVVDEGAEYRLMLAHPPEMVVGGRIGVREGVKQIARRIVKVGGPLASVYSKCSH